MQVGPKAGTGIMTTSATTTPGVQHAIQLVGKGELRLNAGKPVEQPGPRQILGQVEAVGLCFSDLKLLSQFADHPRKAEIQSGIDRDALPTVAGYVPGELPTVPGHEAVIRIVAVGEGVTRHAVGERCLVQTDYRDLLTKGSNAAFGYNFEGALQEYVLLDERVVVDPRGERYLIPADERLGASAVALVEPWACVEDSYVTRERRAIRPGGRLAVVADAGRELKGLREAFSPNGWPVSLTAIVGDAHQCEDLGGVGLPVETAESIEALADEGFDDIVYFGSDAATIEKLNDKLAARGIINVVLGGKKIGRPVTVGVGRIHYGMTRWIGTTGEDASESYAIIPATGELREGDRVLVVGAGGPMGQMHVIRAACSGLAGIEIVGTDFDDARLESLRAKVEPMAQAAGVKLQFLNTSKVQPEGEFTYVGLMAPVAALVADAIERSAQGCVINIFAGIPQATRHAIDLDRCIERGVFMFGTSGSAIEDMKIVLRKVTEGRLDTNLSVDAVSGMAGAIDGLRAVENRTLAGKIVVYPMLHDVGLIPLDELEQTFPTVAARLDHGNWCKEAEEELLRVAGSNGK
jgi:threonine dehydrogenase-like Zn-dependent dehydrogenase